MSEISDYESDNNIVVYNIFENTGGSDGTNANDNGTSNSFRYNYWDDMSGSTAGGIYWNSYPINGSSRSYDFAPREFKQYWNHDELFLASDVQLESAARTNGFLGNGSTENPFRIEYINFSRPMETPLLVVENINHSVLVENCYFSSNGPVGSISLSDVFNFTINYTSIYKSSFAILAIDSYNSRFSNLFINGSDDDSIHLERVYNFTFNNVSINNSYDEGIYIRDGYNITIENSLINNSDGTNVANGIEVKTGEDIAIINTTIQNSGGDGMLLIQGTNLTIFSCTIENCGYDGIDVSVVNTLNISRCVIKGISDTGIALGAAQNVTIELTNVSECYDGIYARGLENSRLEHCNFWNNTLSGIYLYSDSLINNNLFSNLKIKNSSYGIDLESYNSDLVNNTFSCLDITNCTTGVSFYVEGGEPIANNLFRNFTISNINQGILFNDVYGYTSFYNNTFVNSNIEGSVAEGILLEGVNQTTFINCIVKNTGEEGIYILDSFNTFFNNCTILNSGWDGIYIETATNITIANCTVNNTTVNGINAEYSAYITVKNTVISNIKSFGINLHHVWNSTFDHTNISHSYIGFEMAHGGNCNLSYIYCWNSSSWGLDFYNTSNNIISYSDIYNSSIGISLRAFSEYNQIFNNSVHENTNGISIWGFNEIFNNNITANIEKGIIVVLSNNTLNMNRISDNFIGVHVQASSANNTFYGNYFINNIVWDNGSSNNWDNDSHGNFWSNYQDYDIVDPKGIGDSSHPIPGISGAMDNFPLGYFLIGQNLEITPISPANGSIINSSVNIMVAINATTCLFNWDSNANSTQIVTEPMIFAVPVTDGYHSLEIYISNASGHWKYLYLEFIVDNTNPVIVSYDLENNTEVGTGTWIPFFVNDTNYEGFWYSWNESDPVYTSIPGVDAPETPGTWILRVYANDTAGNVANQTIILRILQATDLDLLYPDGGETVFGFCYISWNCSEELSIDIYYSTNSGTSWLLLVQSITETHYFWDTTTVVDGIYYLIRIASTTANKPGSDNSTFTFSIDNSDLQENTVYYSLPGITINVTLSSPTDIIITRLFNVSESMLPNSTFFNTGLYIEIILENESALEFLAISFNYASIEDDILSKGLNATHLRVYFYNETSFQWELADDYDLDEIRKIITGYFNHTTVIGVLGRSESTPPPSAQDFPIAIFLMALLLCSALGGAGLIYEHQMRTQQGKDSILKKLKEIFDEQRKKLQKKE